MGRSLVESGVNLALKNSHRPTRNNPRWLQLLLTLALVAVMLGIDQGVHTPNAGAASPITYIASELSAPRMMALDSSGDLFIADYSSNTVAVLAKTSGTIFGVPVTANKLTTIVSSGLSGPEGIALDTAGDLFITNNTAGTVSVMPAASGTIFGVSVTANTLTTLISSGLSAPIGLVLDSAGDLFIANNTASTVSVMPAASGTIFGVSVTANTLTTIVSGLSAPSGLVFDSAGDLFISNVGGNSVSVMPIASGTIFGVSVTANTLASVVSSGLSGPEGLAFNISGDLFIANNSTNKVSAIAPSGGSIFGVAVAANTLASIVTTGLSAPEGLAFDAGGDLFISNSTANNISAMPAASGTIFGVSVTANSPATIASGLNGPGALAIDSAGNLYVTNETGNSVDVMPVTSGTIFGVPVTAGILATIVSSGLGQPDGLAFDSAGDLFIANFTANTVSVVPAASGTIFGVSVTANVLSVIASGLSGPAGLSFNSAGDLFIANSTASSISVMPIASGTIFGVSVTANTLASVVTSGLSIPNGLSFNLAGDLFIANNSGNSVSVMPQASGTIFGVSVTANTLASVVTSGLSGPAGLTFDSAGDLFITNNSGNSVSVMPQASGTIFGVSVTANTLASVASTGLSAPLGITIDSAGDLFIANNTANSVSELLAFHPVPTVTAVDPAIGSTSGGDVVDIVGSGFVAGSTTVDFGTAPATSVSLGSGDQLTAVSPPGFVGTIDVTVTTPGGTSTTSSADKFEYVSSVATAFVTNQSSGTVTPISTATNTASSSITVGTNPEGIAITPNGTTAYVANNGSGTVTLFNTAIGFTGSPITVGANPIDIAITPNGATAYVVNYSSSTVTPINTSTNVAGSPITVATQPYAIAITPNGAAAYVVSYGSGTVTPINTATNTAGSPITVGTSPVGIAITPDGATAYVTNVGSGTVTPINTATNTAGSPITVGNTPEGIAISFTPPPPLPTVTAVDPAIGSTSGGDTIDIVGSNFVNGGTTVDFGTAAATSVTVNSATQLTAVSPSGLAVQVDMTVTTAGGTSTPGSADKFTYVSGAATAYVANHTSGNVSVINATTNTAGTAITVGTGPYGIAITPNGATAYVTNVGSGTVTPINTATNTAGSPITVGSGPSDIAITPNGATAYVTNNVSGTVTPINISTNTAGSPITVGSSPVGIAITPDGATAYVTNAGSGTVTPINTATNTAGSPITVGATPEGIAITPNGATAYVSNYGSGTVTPISIATNTAGTAITVGTGPYGIAITPNGATAYVTNNVSGTVTPINTATNTAGSPITVGATPEGIAITPNGATAYVTNNGSGTVTPISIATNTAGTAITVGGSLVGIAIAYTPLPPPPTVTAVDAAIGSTSGGDTIDIVGSNFVNGGTTVDFGTAAATSVTVDSATQLTAVSPSGLAGSVDVTVTTSVGTSPTSSADKFLYVSTAATAYVTNSGTTTVTPINTSTNVASAPITVGTGPEYVAVTPNGATAYVVNNSANTVTPINTATNTPGTPIAVGSGPEGIAITPNGATAYVVNSVSNSVTPINIATNTAGAPIAVGSLPTTISITPDGTTAYVTNYGSNSVTPINTATDTAGPAITVGSGPAGIAITPNGATAYVTNNGSGTVTPISIATNTAGTAITVGGSLVGIAITPNGATAYVANGGAGTIIPINTTTNAVGSPITVGSGPHGIALTPDGATAYVANTSSSSVTPVNTSTNSPSTAISVGSGPFGIAISYTLPLPPPPPAPSSYESLALTPSAPSVAPGGSVTFTATFTNSSTSGTSSSTPISGASVSFNVSSGPDAGKTYTSTTNGLGVATYTYSNSGTPGTDSVSAGATDPSNGQVTIASSSIEFVAQDSLVLSPTSQPADVGTTVTITSQALDSSGKQLGGAVVAFTVTGGPDSGQSVTATTSSTGSATFSLSATKQGTDFISATLTDPTTSTQVTSNQVSVVWAAPIVIATIDPGSSSSLGVGSPVTLSVTLSSPVSALLRIHKSINLLKFLSELLLANSSGNTNLPDPGIPVSFSITSGPDTGHSGTSTTNSSGTASWTYRGSSAGTDIITASFADSAGISHSTSMSVNWATTSTTTAPTTSTTMPMTTTSAAPTTTILQISPTSPPSISQGGSTVGPATGQLSPTQLSSPQSTNPPTSPTTSQSITPTTQAFTKNKVNPVKSSKSSSNNNLVALGLASTASSYSSGANISRRIVKALVAAGHRGPDMAYGKGYGLGKGGGPPGVIPLAQSVPSPIEAFRSFTKTAGENSALAFLLIFLIGLPALIFNATLKKHHSNIVSTHGAIRRFVDRIELLLSKLHTGALLFLFALVGSLLYAIVDPTFGLNLSSLAEIIGFIGAIIVSTTVTEIARGAYVKKRFSKVGNLRAFPLGIVMALVFDIFSRLAHFEPGFVFGVLAALVFRVAPTREEDGRSIAWSAAWMMTISTICWFAWIPVKNLVIAGNHNFFILCVDALLSFVWICGLQSLFFGLIPIRSMDGETVFKWSKGAWAAMYLIVTFIFVQFMIHPSAAGFGGNKHTAILPLLAMFFTATLAAVGFWAYTNFKYGKTEEVSESVVENQEPSDSLA